MALSQKTSRRRFLRNASLGVGALTIGSALSQLAWAKPDKKLGIALVGLGGYAGGQLAPALQQTNNCYLAGIITGTPAKAAEWSKKYDIPEKNIYNYQNFDTIASNPNIDI